MSKVLDLAARREAFLQLVRLQDRGCPVGASLDQVAADFQISVSLLRMIEREGLDKEWPPLSGDAAAGEQERGVDVATSHHDAASTVALHDRPANSH